MHCAVTLSANAGLMISWHGCRIWIDVLHNQETQRFSSLTPGMWANIQRYAALESPDFICFTHCHPDHYSREMTLQAHNLWPNAILALPKSEFSDQILVVGREYSYTLGRIKIIFIRLPHEGISYADEPHYGLILQDKESQILVAGDCAVGTPILAEWLTDKSIDLAILDFPWLTLRRGREFVEKFVRPKHLLLCHLPFAEDDSEGYLKAAELAAQKSTSMDVRILQEFLQREVI